LTFFCEKVLKKMGLEKDEVKLVDNGIVINI